MRKRILFFCIEGPCKSYLSDDTSEFLALTLDFLQKKKSKIKEKYDTPIHENIGSPRRSEEVPYTVDESWKKSEKKKPESHSEKHYKVKRIESLTPSNTQSNDRNDDSRNNKCYLKKSHAT